MYYSTNRKLNTDRIVGFKKLVTFKEALFIGLAPDEGLFMPSIIPRLSKKEILSLKDKGYHEVANIILRKFLSREIKGDELEAILKDAYDFDIPIEKLDVVTYIVRLDRGPTASFKDFAARFMARIMYKLKPKNKNLTILVATSGDTGSAIGEAYKRVDGIKVYILYPHLEVSHIQKKQLDSMGGNVKSVAIDGKFDDCQKLVKEAFLDPDLHFLNLTSANSINIARILPQIVYYFYSYTKIIDSFEPVVFSIPSGNFGNALGCEIARRMGLPIKKIIVAVNENDEFPRFLNSGIYKKIEQSKVCLSNSMNIGNPSNLARFFDLYGGILDKDGIVHKKPNIKEMNEYLYSISISDKETIRTIKKIYKIHKIIIEPHGAVCIAAWKRYAKKYKKDISICLETADPAKFPEVIKNILNISPRVPYFIRKLIKAKYNHIELPNDYTKFKRYLLKRYEQWNG